MTEHRSNFPQFYLTSPQPCPYLAGQLERKLFTHLTQEKPGLAIDSLLKGGFRRSQNIAYMPYCENCSACVPVRVVVDDFQDRKSFRRIRRTNTDLAVNRIPAVPTSEQYSLFRDYIDGRHAEGGMADMSVLDYAMMVEDSVVETFLTEYRFTAENSIEAEDEEQPLAAVALTDVLSDGLSMVYSFFAPDLEPRSLGTYMILDHIEYARKLGLPYVYLGYWIAGSRKMDYKTRFAPQEHLSPDGWIPARDPIAD